MVSGGCGGSEVGMLLASLDDQFWKSLSGGQIALFVAPFVLLLLSIAILPLATPHFWEKNKNKGLIAFIFGAPVALYFLVYDWHKVFHTAMDYLAFIALLASLFTISGGIHVRGAFAGLPIVNTAFLAIGAVLANLIGTTGASMLLIRPLIRANERRRHKAHIIIFFIFIVSNCAGCLTPLGDPPLFLGFLLGVPFDWTLRLLPQWAFMVVSLLILFNLFDQYQFNKEDLQTRGSLVENVAASKKKLEIEGKLNFLYLLCVIATIVIAGYVVYPRWGDLPSKVLQIVLMALLAVAAFKTTRPQVREANGFTFHPIIEVAVLFAGIFAAMIPALEVLANRGGELGVSAPWQFFWMTGALSGFLDNAPTYLTYATLAKSTLHIPGEGLGELVRHPEGARLLSAVSCGAVFMGANTYIGNGPNFMVKAIAEEAKIGMPGFFGYMTWSAAVLIPLFIGLTFLFFR